MKGGEDSSDPISFSASYLNLGDGPSIAHSHSILRQNANGSESVVTIMVMSGVDQKGRES